MAESLKKLWAGLALSLPGLLSIAPTHSVYSLADSASLSGKGQNHVGAIAISGGTGTIELDGNTLTTVIQDRIAWASQNETLYQGLAFDATHWDIYWIYCAGTTDDSEITTVFYEGMSGPKITLESASGTCQDSPGQTQVPVDLPAIQLQTLSPVQGFSIDGTDMQLASGQIGTLQIPAPPSDTASASTARSSSSAFNFLPFSAVDCTDCGGSGWYELHSIFWNQTPGQACFGILYLDLPDGKVAASSVQISYSFCLPDPSLNLDGKYPASWSKVGNPQMTPMSKPRP